MSEETTVDMHKQASVHSHQSIPMKKRKKRIRSFKDILTILLITLFLSVFGTIAIYSVFLSTKCHAINEREHESFDVWHIIKPEISPHNFSSGVCIECGYRKKDDGFSEAQKAQLQDIINQTIAGVEKDNKSIDKRYYVIDPGSESDNTIYIPIENNKHLKILNIYGTSNEHCYYIEDCKIDEETHQCKFCKRKIEKKSNVYN